MLLTSSLSSKTSPDHFANNPPQTIKALFRHIFLSSTLFLVFFIVPLDLLSRLNLFVLSLDWQEILIMTGGMVIIMTVVSLILSLMITLFAAILRIPAGHHTFTIVAKIFNHIALFLLAYNFARTFKVWVETFQYEITIKAVVIAIFIWLLAVLYYRERVHDKITGLINTSRLPLIGVLVFSFCLNAWQVGVTIHKRNAATNNLKAATPSLSKNKPNIILITFDALSAEDMSLYGYPLKTTPNIDAFSKECYVFENAYSASNWTRPSIGALLTGRYPNKHFLNNNNIMNTNCNLPEFSLPAVLKSQGYQNNAISANLGYAHPLANGMYPYFDSLPYGYDDPESNSRYFLERAVGISHQIRIRYGTKSPMWLVIILAEIDARVPFLANSKYSSKPWFPPSLVFNDAKKLLSQNVSKSESAPIFLWTHIIPPHFPYLPGAKFKGHFLPGEEFSTRDSIKLYDFGGHSYDSLQQAKMDRLRKRYDENILYADDGFGHYLDFLKKKGYLESSIVIISADHGESFSHRFQGHGGLQLYQPLIHIPLLIHLPGQKTGKRIATNVSQVDLAPTIMELTSMQLPNWLDGESLKNIMSGTSNHEKPVFSMHIDGKTRKGAIKKGTVAVIFGTYKYIYNIENKLGELYNLAQDPNETINLVAVMPDKAKTMRMAVINKLSELPQP